MTSVAVFGSEGRMGRLVREEAGASVVACYDPVSPDWSTDPVLPDAVDVIIDFSLPAAWSDLDRLLTGSEAALVSGTTGLDAACEQLLNRWSAERPVFRSANMSLGVFVLGRLLEEAAELLGGDFSLEIVEFHHEGKLDSPSGTALTLFDVWKRSGGGPVEVNGRAGRVGPRNPLETGIHSVRGGDVAGEHQLHLLGDGERLTLSHSASGRRVFALGALRAAEFIKGKSPGLYSMEDMVGCGSRRG